MIIRAKRKSKDEDVIYLHGLKYSDTKIAKKLNCSTGTISCIRYRLGLKAHYIGPSGENIDPKTAHKRMLKYRKIYNKENKEILSEQRKRYSLTHRKEVRRWAKKYYYRDIEKNTKRRKVYYQKNRETILKKAREKYREKTRRK